MKKFIFVIALCVIPLLAQQPAPETTIARLKLQLAQANVQIAGLKLQILNLQAEIQVLQSPDYQSKIAEALAEQNAAQKALNDAMPKQAQSTTQK